MAKSSKSGKKANKKVVSGGLGAVIVIIVLIIAIFFTYISGRICSYSEELQRPRDKHALQRGIQPVLKLRHG